MATDPQPLSGQSGGGLPVIVLMDDGTWEPAVAIATQDTEKGHAALCRLPSDGLTWWAFRMGPDPVDEWHPAPALSRNGERDA